MAGFKDDKRLFNKVIRSMKTSDFAVLAGIVGGRGGAQESGSPLSVAQVAAVHEYGTRDGKIPRRPFISQPFDKNQKKFNSIIKKYTEKSPDPKKGKETGLFLAAEFYIGEIIKSINARMYQKLSPRTIQQRRKNDTLPLIDTGQMINALGTRVESKSNAKYLKG